MGLGAGLPALCGPLGRGGPRSEVGVWGSVQPLARLTQGAACDLRLHLAVGGDALLLMAELLKIFVSGELRPHLAQIARPVSPISPHYSLGSVSLESSVFQGPQPQTPDLPASRDREAAGAEAQGHWGSSPPAFCTSCFSFHGRSGHPQCPAGPGRGPGPCGRGTAGEGAASAGRWAGQG